MEFKPRRIVKTLTSESTSLGGKTARSSFWLLSAQLGNRIFDFARTIVLARLLAPADFGLFGVVLLVSSILDTFTQTGFQQALIQNRDDSDCLLNTAWTVTIIKSVIVAALLLAASFFAPSFFNSADAGPLLRVFALNSVINGLSNIKAVYLQKEMMFHKQFIFVMLGTLAYTTVSIALAVILKNAWAMVIGTIAGSLVSCIVSYIVIPYRPVLELAKEKVAKLWKFGKWLTGSSVLTFLLTDADDLLVSKLLGTETLGYYQMSYKISNLPSTEITSVISGATFPAYASIQDRHDKLQLAFSKVFRTICFLSIPLGAAIFALSASFTNLFLGEKWASIIPVIQLLVVWGVIRSLVATTSSVLMAIGRPKLMTILQAGQVVLMYIGIVPLTLSYGIIGTSTAVVASALIMFFARVYFSATAIGLRLSKIFVPVITSIGSVALSIVAVLLFRYYFSFSTAFQFILEVLLFTLLYLVSSAIMAKVIKIYPLRIFRYMFEKLLK